MPLNSAVINNTALILDSEPETIELFMRNGVDDYKENIEKYNIWILIGR